LGKVMGKVKKAKREASAPKASISADGEGGRASGVAKKKHARTGKLDLVQKLQAEAEGQPRIKTSNVQQKSRRKRSAQSAILGAVDGMKASLEELLAANEERLSAQHKQEAKSSSAGLTSKKRQKLVAEESQHMIQVLQHPAFVANPFAALQEHLKNTVGAMHMDRSERKERRR
jgi:excinuclease UvrABC helicase subunit UvrB